MDKETLRLAIAAKTKLEQSEKALAQLEAIITDMEKKKPSKAHIKLRLNIEYDLGTDPDVALIGLKAMRDAVAKQKETNASEFAKI